MVFDPLETCPAPDLGPTPNGTQHRILRPPPLEQPDQNLPLEDRQRCSFPLLRSETLRCRLSRLRGPGESRERSIAVEGETAAEETTGPVHPKTQYPTSASRKILHGSTQQTYERRYCLLSDSEFHLYPQTITCPPTCLSSPIVFPLFPSRTRLRERHPFPLIAHRRQTRPS